MKTSKIYKVTMPDWLRVLDVESPVIAHAMDVLKRFTSKTKKEISIEKVFEGSPYFQSLVRVELDEESGAEKYEIIPHDDLYFKVLTELSGISIIDQTSIVSYVANVSSARRELDKLAEAIAQMNQTGYGVVRPTWDTFTLEEPQLYRQGKNFGVKLRATGKSIHLISVDVNSEVAPIIGEQAQSEEMLTFLQQEYKVNQQTVWETPIFGKSLESIVRDDIEQKSTSMPMQARGRMQKTLARIINNGRGGVICILL